MILFKKPRHILKPLFFTKYNCKPSKSGTSKDIHDVAERISSNTRQDWLKYLNYGYRNN